MEPLLQKVTLCAVLVLFVMTSFVVSLGGTFPYDQSECGPYGFTCEGASRLRLCEGSEAYGPSFLCPAQSVCNEESSNVCDNISNYVHPSISRVLKCRRNERLADPTVANCKGYILCIPNKNRFQGIKFKCSGSTIFNGVTRTCTAPSGYKCPLVNTTKSNHNFGNSDYTLASFTPKNGDKPRPIECKNYRFSLSEVSPTRATFFCPSRPAPGERYTRCTIFSSNFCITLERDDEDQFDLTRGVAYRRPRFNIN